MPTPTLDIVAANENEVVLQIDIQSLEDADELVLTELCDSIGGGYYHMKKFEDQRSKPDIWLCNVGNIPPKIYVKRV